MVGVCMRGEALAPYLLIHKFHFTDMANPSTGLNNPVDVCYIPQVNDWLLEQHDKLSYPPQVLNLDELNEANELTILKRWYMELYPQRPQGSINKKMFGYLYPGIEATINEDYDPLPSLQEIANRIKPVKQVKTFKRRRKTENSPQPTKLIKMEQEEQTTISEYDVKRVIYLFHIVYILVANIYFI
ncbi:hypothetical protein BDC45DRAFT_184030 [Circinella umbellata]|nr:hypothetical protein BDC45DRAFT_184030 [Circinella umbellata]